MIADPRKELARIADKAVRLGATPAEWAHANDLAVMLGIELDVVMLDAVDRSDALYEVRA